MNLLQELDQVWVPIKSKPFFFRPNWKKGSNRNYVQCSILNSQLFHIKKIHSSYSCPPCEQSIYWQTTWPLPIFILLLNCWILNYSPTNYLPWNSTVWECHLVDRIRAQSWLFLTLVHRVSNTCLPWNMIFCLNSS